MMKLIQLLILLLLSTALMAQERVIRGTVKDGATGDPLPGVNVYWTGTATGTITGMDGVYQLPVVDQSNTSLSFSFVGFVTQIIELTEGQTTVNISLQYDEAELEEIVVTAFGLEREKKALGYAVSEVKGAELSMVNEPNLVNSLSGKVPGVTVSKTASGAGGSSRVLIRGASSLTGNNQPLYIVDGIPIDNQNINAAIRWGGVDYGDGIGDINSNDIQEMTVLKGPSAAALYGARAANGVILITTKSGENKKGVGVEYNGTFTFESPLVLPDFQNTYGAGTGGVAPASQAEALALGSDATPSASWGQRLDGSLQHDWSQEGQTPYLAQASNIEDFYQQGHTYANTIAFRAGGEHANVRLSYTNFNNKGILPTNTFERHSLSARAKANMTDKFSMDLKVNYITADAYNRPYMAEIMENVAHSMMWMPRSVRMDDLKVYQNADGSHRNYTNGIFRMNPYWSVNKNYNDDDKRRLLGMTSLKYDFSDAVSLQVRTGLDFYNTNRRRRVALGTPYRPLGEYFSDSYEVLERNTDVLLSLKKNFMSDMLTTQLLLGGNLMKQETQGTLFHGSELVVPDLWHSNNFVSQEVNETIVQKKVNSIYFMLNLAYQNMIFLDVTGRNDWSSAIPDKSFFYPSATLSWAFSETFNTNQEGLTFGKLRLAFAEVGSDTDPYRTAQVYSVKGSHLGQPLGAPGIIGNQYVPTMSFANANLIPETTRSFEVGFDTRFLNNRIGLDFTYYNATTFDQILPVTVSSTSGGNSAIINSGKMTNEGIELALNILLVQSKGGFEWETTFNFARNRNKVVELTNNLDQLVLAVDRGIAIEARPGNAYGDIVGLDYRRDEQGRLIFDENGLPLAAEEVSVLGNINPDFTAGWVNTFRYKGFSLNVLLDMKQGGDLYSISNRSAYANGNHTATLEGREGGLNVNGVTEGGNTINSVNPEDYWQAVVNRNISKDFVYDASYIKLREISFGYTLPSKYLGKVFQSASLSIVGRNLAFLKNNVPGLDPEASYNVGNGQGIESAAIPSTRSIGFNLNFSL